MNFCLFTCWWSLTLGHILHTVLFITLLCVTAIILIRAFLFPGRPWNQRRKGTVRKHKYKKSILFDRIWYLFQTWLTNVHFLCRVTEDTKATRWALPDSCLVFRWMFSCLCSESKWFNYSSFIPSPSLSLSPLSSLSFSGRQRSKRNGWNWWTQGELQLWLSGLSFLCQFNQVIWRSILWFPFLGRSWFPWSCRL